MEDRGLTMQLGEPPSDQPFDEARILIVDDQVHNVEVLEQMLRMEGFSRIMGVTDPTQAVATLRTFHPDLVCLDLLMPVMDGFSVLESMAPDLAGAAYLPVVVLSADISAEARRRALAMGARDFVGKPFDPTEVLLRIRNVLETRFLYQRLRRYTESLEEQIRERTAQLSQN